MGCFSHDSEKGPKSEEQKWGYITLSDFRSKSCWTTLSYIWLWVLAIITVAVYVADTFTAVNLLAFDKYTGIDPAIKLEISKWIFVGCIIFSWVLAGLEWLRAIRIIKAGGIAESYLDPLAAVLQSMRMGKTGQGWRRFLVFAELTKSKKGTDYIALFVYFQFKSAIRIILAEGPRQVVNAVTLYSVAQSKVLVEGIHSATNGRSDIEQFWVNLKALAEADQEQAVVLSTMLFTLVIWAITAIGLIIAVVLYLVFLWHSIPNSDGTLARYCKRKIDSRLEKIVSKKVKKALQKQEEKRIKQEQKALKHGDIAAPAQRKPTLPILEDDKSSQFGLSRTNTSSTVATLPPYSSQPPSRSNTSSTARTMPQPQRQPTLPSISESGYGPRPGMPSRNNTQSSGYSNSSYRSNAPLLGNSSEMGYSEPPVPPMPAALQRNDSYQRGPPMARTMTSSSQQSRPFTPGSQQQRSFTPMSRTGTAPPMDGRNSPATSMLSVGVLPNTDQGFGPPARTNTGFSSQGSMGRLPPGPTYGPNSNFAPFNRNEPSPPRGPSYEMSPVESPQDMQGQQYFPPARRPPPRQFSSAYTASAYSDDYDPYRAGTPVQRLDPLHMRQQSDETGVGEPTNVSSGNGVSSRGNYVAYNPGAQTHAQDLEAARSGSVSPINEQDQRQQHGPSPGPRILSPVNEQPQQRQQQQQIGGGLQGLAAQAMQRRGQPGMPPRSNTAPAQGVQGGMPMGGSPVRSQTTGPHQGEPQGWVEGSAFGGMRKI